MVVLIVEDEALLRMMAAESLEAAGFAVIQAANADEAISVLEDHDEIRVVFTDIDMPGSMDGMKLARAVRGRWPPIAIIATSGHTPPDAVSLPEGGRFLRKPYSVADVIRTIEDVTA